METTSLARQHSFKIVVFAFVVFAFLLLGYRNEVHDAQLRQAQVEIDRSQRQTVENFDYLAGGLRANCEARNRAVVKFNAALDAAVLADLEVRADPKRRAAALASVVPFKQVPDDCDRYPRPGQGAPRR